MLTAIGAIDIYACMCLSRDALMRIRCERNWNWIRIRIRNRKSKSNRNRNRLWRNRGRTPRVINVVAVVVYGVLLTAGKNCTRVFPGNLFSLAISEAWAYFGASRPPCSALLCLAAVRPTTFALSLDYCQLFSLKCSNRRKWEAKTITRTGSEVKMKSKAKQSH